ncbi:sigma-70 family RNA polymerase sigma factor [Pseudenhygromyxa sp. WMMC2535]|uniref:RNA polymerase sigma factor n=1 Tax=Pseudenhygromyxa sp. WMMC2535 TaxID=2712867 RepID=UPI001556E298|nr:sigma-70 family RNA polymerase sigma factor [Pseudenhygromyxa sp. WMMC2535]NVB40241.1 sigma-70 family RNA polymerase sigma factor [Pseudenhygromyxa sp. WMMC2535]
MVRQRRAPSAEFAAAYREHVDFVWRVLARRGVAASELEDVTQEVFLVAHRRWGAWEAGGSMRAWLYGVARRVAATHHRGRARRLRKHEALAPASAEPSLDARLDDRKRLAALGEAIAALEASQREVFVLAEIESMSAPEIAESLGSNLNTVYSRLRRARARIARAMADHDEPTSTSGAA